MAPGWSHYNDDYNDEDEVLDISERNEAALRPDQDTEWWRAKLHDLEQEDDIDGTLRSSHLDDGEALPRRWQDAGPSFSTSRRTLDSMGDEEYLEYLREGMESRRRHQHGGSAAAGAPPPRLSRREEERKRADAQRAREKAQRHKAKAERRKRKAEYEEYHELVEERAAWLKKWAEAKSRSGGTSTRYFSDVAWPVRTPRPGQLLRLDKEAIAEFLIGSDEPAPSGYDEWAAHRQRKRDRRSKQPPTEDQTDKAHSSSSKDLLRTALLVFHPDRFFSSPLYASLSEEGGQKERVHECVVRVAQVLSELVEERRTKQKAR